MLRNYFKIAWRNIYRRKLVSVINIVGLSFGISACLVIFLITKFELSYDKFHPGLDRIYRITGTIHMDGTTLAKFSGKRESSCGCAPVPAADALRQEVTGFESVAGFYIYDADVKAPQFQGPKFFFRPKPGTAHPIVFAQPEYFNILKYQWLAGDSQNALKEPYNVVLTASEASRYFGQIQPQDVIGKTLIYDDSIQFSVSGIVQDWAGKSDFDFKDFLSWSTITSSNYLKERVSYTEWGGWPSESEVFVKLAPNTNLGTLNTQLVGFAKKHAKPTMFKPSLGLQRLSDVHFNPVISDATIRKASLPVLFGLMAIAAFILVIAAINFINLATAQSLQRAKEIGIRKVLGSSRRKLVIQFLSETSLLATGAVILSILMINPLLSLLYSIIPQGVTFKPTETGTIIFLTILTILTSLLAGFYPSKVLSSFLPALSLKGQVSSSAKKGYLRRSLLVFQFTVSLLFIIGTIVVANQIHFMLNADLGFNKDAIINIKTDETEPLSNRDHFVQNLKALPGVAMVSISQNTPSSDRQSGTFINKKGQDVQGAQHIMADENFLPLYGIRLVAGHNYRHSDTINQLLINESAVRILGFKKPEDALGQMIFIGTSDRPNSSQTFPVTGIIADFHSTSLRDPVKPLFIAPALSLSHEISVKFPPGSSAESISSTIASIARKWKLAYPERPFEYEFFDESIGRLYDNEQKISSIINLAMCAAILISCMGLFGLVTFTTEQRTKEIGLRKVLGASVQDIVFMLCRDFVRLVALSTIIASPIAWYFANNWLQGFPYRVSISWWVFILAGLAAVSIALFTVSFQTIKAATVNPVKSLRS